MLKAEAQWIGQFLAKCRSEQISPLLNVGSATAEFREKVQPYIDGEIFSPLRERRIAVDHLDMLPGDGIDLRGDLNDISFVETLAARGYQAVLCSNVLEHLAEPAVICTRLENLLPAKGILIVTVPRDFPYHPDPIDTMFRPSVDDLKDLFPHSRLLVGTEIDCGTGWAYMERNPLLLIGRLAHRLANRKEFGGLRGSSSFFPYLVRRFRMTCAAFEKGA